jgi:hypothetical protein
MQHSIRKGLGMILDHKMNLIVLIMSAWLFVAPASAEDFSTVFPGRSPESISPNGRYLLHNIDTALTEPNHALFLCDLKTIQCEKLLAYNRWVKVMWSPNGNNLIVNDHSDSNYSDCIIFQLSSKNKPIEIRREILKMVGNKKHILGNDHVYIDGFRWISQDRVKVRVSGHGAVDPDGFTLWYNYVLGDGFHQDP